jgi:glycosyltransferase involved in cell wall biosynthesis
VDTEEMHKAEALDETVARQIPSDKFIVGYAGTIGLANGMDYFLEAANLLRDRDEILFVMAGKGNEKEKFVQKAKEYGLRNVLFLPPVPKKQIFSLLQKFDVCVSFLTKNLFRFGVSPNKIFDYMLAGKPVLFFVNSPGNPVEKSGCGWVIPEVSVEEVAQSVLKMSRLDKEERQKMGQRGKEYVLQNHTFQVLAARYHDVMKSL